MSASDSSFPGTVLRGRHFNGRMQVAVYGSQVFLNSLEKATKSGKWLGKKWQIRRQFRDGEDNGKKASALMIKLFRFWVVNNRTNCLDTSMNIPECCQTSKIHCLTTRRLLRSKLQVVTVRVRFSQKVVVSCTLSVQTGEAVGSSQSVPPVLIVPLVCLRWKDLLRGRLQRRDGSASPLWRGESNCCRAKRSTEKREIKIQGSRDRRHKWTG